MMKKPTVWFGWSTIWFGWSVVWNNFASIQLLHASTVLGMCSSIGLTLVSRGPGLPSIVSFVQQRERKGRKMCSVPAGEHTHSHTGSCLAPVARDGVAASPPAPFYSRLWKYIWDAECTWSNEARGTCGITKESDTNT